MKQENIFENMKLNKSEIVKQRVGEIRLFVKKLDFRGRKWEREI